MNIVVQKESLVLRLYSSLHHSLYACLLVNLSKVTYIALECSFGYSSFGYSQNCIKERNSKGTLVFQLQDTVCLFGTLLVFDPIHLPKSDTWCLIGSEQKEKEPLLLIGSCCCEVYQFWREWFLMSHSLYLEHAIQNDNRDLYSTQYIFNIVSHYFYSVHDTNEVVSHYFYSAHLF